MTTQNEDKEELKQNDWRSEDTIIYHYTGVDTLFEFLKPDAKLYATHYAFMNDKDEMKSYQESFEKVREKLPKLMEKAKQPTKATDLENSSSKKISREKADLSSFIICFSESDDDLSQWRAYAPQGGYAIGFSANELFEMIEGKTSTFGYLKGQEFTKSNSIKPKIRDIKEGDSFETIFMEKCDYGKHQCDLIELEGDLFQIYNLLFHKHDAFKAEKEVRIVSLYSTPDDDNRLAYIGGKPRIELKLKAGCKLRDAIKRVIVAPHGNTEKNYNLVGVLCKSYQLQNIEITKSELPLSL